MRQLLLTRLLSVAPMLLLVSLFAFLLVLATVFFPSQRSRFDHAAQLPFDDGTTPSSTASEAVR